jgi:hypothetical protein
MEEKIRETIEHLNVALGEAPYKLAYEDPAKIKLLDKNAHYMGEDVFRNLVENIKRDGAMASMPLCQRGDDGRLLVLSGNHRVQAAVHAGLDGVMVMVIDREITNDEKIAIQLSHNSLVGKDDPVLLKELWDEIKDIDLKMYAGLDSELLEELDKLEFLSIAEARLDHKSIMFLFLPEEQGALQKTLAEMDMMFMDDEHYVLSRKHYDDVFAMLADVKEKFRIMNNPTALMKIMELAREQLQIEPESADN